MYMALVVLFQYVPIEEILRVLYSQNISRKIVTSAWLLCETSIKG